MESLILLHGALGSERQFNRLTEFLRDHLDVHSFNFEGHGGKNLKGRFEMQTFEQNVLDYMEENSLHRSSFFGFSMGGYVALRFALNNSNRVEKIVTYGTKFDWTPDFASAEVRKLNPDKIAEKVPQFARHLEGVHAPLDWKKVVSDTAEMMLGLGDNKELRKEDFQQMENPTLILLGALDTMSTQEESIDVANHLMNGVFESIPNFEHPIERVNHELLAEKIMKFVLSEG